MYRSEVYWIAVTFALLVSHRRWIALAAASLILAGCGGLGTTSSKDGGGGKGKGKGKGGNAGPVAVLAVAASLKDVPIEIQVVGNVEAYSTVSLRAQVSGQLTAAYLKDGDFVKKGAPLFAIDPRTIDGQMTQAEANLARSSAQLAQAQANLARDAESERYARGVAERYGKLAEEGVFSQDQARQTRNNADVLAQSVAADKAAILSAQAQISADQASINNIKIQRGYTTVFAPVDGRTGNVTQKEGNIVTANNTELAVIHQVEPIYVTFAVPESRLGEVKGYFDQGGRLAVTTKAQDGSGAAESGELTFIDNAVDTSTGTIKLKGTFKNSAHNLWPGQFVNVTLQLTTRRGAVVVPNQAVQTGQDGTFVYVVGDDNKVSFRPVKVGPRVDLDLVIDEGLKAGEVVVTEGQLRLQPGSEVQLRDGQGNGGGRGASKGDASPGDKGKGGFGDNNGSKGKSEFKGKGDFKSGGA